MLLTALPPAPPTPNTVMRGFSSRMSGIFKLMLMAASRVRSRPRRVAPPQSRPNPPSGPPAHAGRAKEGDSRYSEAFPKPSSHPGEITARPRLDVPRVAQFEMFQVRKLRID